MNDTEEGYITLEPILFNLHLLILINQEKKNNSTKTLQGLSYLHDILR